MEFKLNKIDTDIRKKIEEERKESKVHSGKSINVNKDLHDESKKYIDEKSERSPSKKRFIIVDGVKYNKNEIKIKVEKDEKLSVQNSIGRILDAKK